MAWPIAVAREGSRSSPLRYAGVGAVLVAVGLVAFVQAWLVTSLGETRLSLLLILLEGLLLLSPLIILKVETALLAFVALVALGAIGQLLGEQATVLPFAGMWLAGLWAARFVVYRRNLAWAPEFNWMVAYGALVLVASVGGADPGRSFRPLLTTAELLAFTFLVVQIVREPRWAFAIGWAVIGSLTAIALVLLVSQWGGVAVPGLETVQVEGTLRVGGVVSGLNTSSVLIGVGAIFAVAYFLYERRLRVRALLILCAACMVLASAQAASVTGSVVLGLGVALLGSGLYRRMTPGAVMRVLVVALIVLATVYFASPSIQSRLQAKLQEVTTQDFRYWGSHRGATMLGAVEVARQYPLLGVGLTNGQYFIARTWPFAPNDNIGAHNTYLGIASDVGIPAALVFTAMAFGALNGLYRVLRTLDGPTSSSYSAADLAKLKAVAAATLVGLACLLIPASMTLDLARSHYLWLLLGLAVALRLQIRARQEVQA